jgi:hypothetical protein
MKKFITILMSCSLALAATAMAQDEQPTPNKKQQEQHEKAKPKEHAAKPTRTTRETHPQQGAERGEQNAKTRPANNARQEQENAKANAEANQRRNQRNNSRPAATNNQQANSAAARANAQRAQQANRQNAQPNNRNPRAAKRPDVKVVQQIKAQHRNFHAQARPQQVPAVTFNQNYRINNSEHWQGPQYAAFRSYHPERHDQGWYRSHYSRIELIGGGYYYWNSGYWYPAWGYNPSASYYVYNGPIYTGSAAEPPDQVIADVQSILQQQGYYKGDVDGLLGPLTRQALTDYQAANGLYTTAAIDQPTLDSLGING